MSKQNPIKKDFLEILERGASIDSLFKDAPNPKGSNPFQDIHFEEKTDFVKELVGLINKTSLSFNELLNEVLSITIKQIPSEGASFIEVDYTNQMLFFRGVSGSSSKELLNFTIPTGQGVAGFVCEMQQPLVLTNIEDSSAYLKTISNSVGFNTRNMMAYPIIIRGKTFGCLELLNRVGQSQYTESDKSTLNSICEIASIVIENRLILANLSKAAFGKKKLGEAA